MASIEKKISDILLVAKNAPSGDNSQPWRFSVASNQLTLFNDESKTNPIFDSKQYGAYVGHGCLIQNIREVATENNYDIQVSYFPEGKSNPVAVLTFSERADQSKKTLAEYVPLRRTNRNPYKNEPLPSSIKDDIATENVVFLEGEDKKQAAKHLSKAEKIVFETPELQDIIFSSLRWNPQEESAKKEGLYVKTLELNPVQVLLLKAAKNRKILELLNAVGFSSLVSKSNEEVYVSSAALGFIVGTATPESYVRAGESLEKIWLEGMSHGMDMQIINGLVFMAQDISVIKDKTRISTENLALLENGIAELNSLLHLPKDKKILSAFRIGYPKKEATTTSTKHSFDELIYKTP